MTTNTFAKNISAAPVMTKTKRMTSLQYNIANMKLGRLEMGSPKWIKLATKIAKHLNYPEIANVGIRYGKPWFLAQRTLPTKVERMEGLIRQCPSQEVCAITVVTSIAKSKEEALAIVQCDADSLDRYIRRRFSDALWVLLPEVDIKLASDVSPDVLSDRSWSEEIAENQLVYFIHFHGVLHVAGLQRDGIEEGFNKYRNGKRVTRFSGSRQVRVQNLRERDGVINLQQEVKSIIGYGTKRHFRPPTKQRMHEGYVEWMWLTDKIASNTCLIRTGGSTGFQRRAKAKAIRANTINHLMNSAKMFTSYISRSLFKASVKGIDLNSEYPTIEKPYDKLTLAKFFHGLKTSVPIGGSLATSVCVKPP